MFATTKRRRAKRRGSTATRRFIAAGARRHQQQHGWCRRQVADFRVFACEIDLRQPVDTLAIIAAADEAEKKYSAIMRGRQGLLTRVPTSSRQIQDTERQSQIERRDAL